jgi:protein-L-isoaspartate(D-aspartate) O-methyltransferase
MSIILKGKTMDNFFIARANMIKGQVLPNKITNATLLEIISNLPRQSFVPEEFKTVSYSDKSIPLGSGRYLIPPVVLARMIQAAGVGKDDVVLDVGCGSGYSSAVLSGMAKKVVAIESDADLATKANVTLRKMDIGNVIILNHKLVDGHAETGPYDVIFFNGAIEHTPHNLLNQLAEGGRLVAVVNETPLSGIATRFLRKMDTFIKADLFNAVIDVIPEFRRLQYGDQM